MIGFYNYTVILTYISLASAFTGIIIGLTPEQIFNGIDNSLWAILCLMISGCCDMFDGKIARSKKDRTDAEKKFGIQIDSLADLVCFGVLPASIGYSIIPETIKSSFSGILFIAIFIFFVLAALIRLAYFNVMEEERQSKTTENRKEYEGLPVTNTSLIMPFIYIFKFRVGDYFYILYTAILFIVGCAFIIKFRVKKVGMKAMLFFLLIGIIEFACIWAEVRS